MRFILLFATLLAIAPLSAAAQDAAPAPAEGQAEQAPQASVDELIRILENEEARNALLSRLKAQAAEAPAAAAQEAEPTLARQIAEQTQAMAEQLASAGQELLTGIAGIAAAFTGGASIDFAGVRDAAIAVVLVGVGLFAAFFVARLLGHWIQRRLAQHVEGRHWVMRATFAALATAIDLVLVAVAWGAGYLIALQVVGGSTGRMGINQTLLLNAFLMVEIIKVGMRTVLQPSFPAFRFIGLGDTTAAYWYFWAARVVSLLGYTFMFVAPVVAANVSPAAAQAVRVIVMLTAVVIGIIIVLQNRDKVKKKLAARATAGRHDALSRAFSALAGVWHIIAILYLIAILIVWLVNPRDALPFMLAATIKSLIAVVIGSLIIAFISRFVNVGMRLPEDLRERLPALEPRLQAFVPRVMQVVRTVVLIGIVIAVAQAWGLIDFLDWAGSARGQLVIGSLVSAAFVLLIGFIIYLAIQSWIDYRLNPNFGSVPTAREKTLLALFRNAFTVVLVVMVIMLTLAQIGVNIAPLLAGAGVVGLAVGFGAQKLVQDIITGVFIQLENIMNEGDVVNIGSTGGVVEKLTIRSVSLRDLSGTLHLIPFSSVDTVSNMVKGFAFHVAEIGVAYRENITEVKEAMQEAFDLLMETEHKEKIIAPLDMQGITEFGDSAIMVRARIKTVAGGHWAAGRAYNEIIKEVFDRRGIEIPFPHVTLYMGEDKAGKAPPLYVKQLNGGNGIAKQGDQPTAEAPPEAAEAAAGETAKKPARKRTTAKKPKLLPPPAG
ncbi:mechanosensitive ion channel protein MscS [Agaricicola taiwanensis]|uniref:Mechanosensitive ion channel protein MscS n=1 Tax=Agaricicola taiwanensis TaxID=591372 RepID=A0A8J2YKR7_9RHOB|nr:mechanosensitive ion channel domain-containing protein [Agaricicola taiwanensis]GGE51731.1 mechanosensitive ion channel protein MscS [Agaricicola taiwanensis]